MITLTGSRRGWPNNGLGGDSSMKRTKKEKNQKIKKTIKSFFLKKN